MLREVFKRNIGQNQEFRFRGEEPGRLENFSDAVFALAITLLLISTNAPSDFQQIKNFVWELIPFTACITLIIIIWQQHFVFYYRYGLRNPKVVFWNTVFLIIVLFYVYPLRFLAKAILIPIALLFDQQQLLERMIPMYRGMHMADLMIIYGIGASLVFVTLSQMYRYALGNAAKLELNEIEIFDTKVSMYSNLMFAGVPALSAIFAILFYNHWSVGYVSGNIYFLYPVLTYFFHHRVRKKRKILLLNAELMKSEISGSNPALVRAEIGGNKPELVKTEISGSDVEQ